jgi:hypothetical protein
MRGMRARRLERTFMWEGGQLQARRPRKPLLLFNKSTVFDEQYRSWSQLRQRVITRINVPYTPHRTKLPSKPN